MGLSGAQFRLVAGEHEATIVEVGAGIRRYAVGGRDVTLPYPDDVLTPKGCGAVLVPWPNRIRGGRYRFDGVDHQLAITEPARGNASHGLARWARWTPVAQSDDELTLAVDVVPQPGWPFELRAEVTYRLDPDTGLGVTATARNTGSRRLPFGMGFHPYVSIGAVPLSDVAVRLAATQRIVADESGIPVGRRGVRGTPYDLADGAPLGERRLDDAFTGLHRDGDDVRVEVRAGDHGARVRLGRAFDYVQIFTAESVVGGRGGVAVEPMSCPANAFNSGDGLAVLEPGQEWRGDWGIEPL